MENQSPVQTQNPASQSTTQPVPKQPSEPKPKLSKWIIVSIVVLILAIPSYAIISSLYTPITGDFPRLITPTTTPTPITNWRTYTNAKYNYSIEYPSNWSVREFPDPKTGAGFNPLDKPGYPNESESIIIDAGQKTGNYVDYPFEDYVKIAATKEIQNYNKLASIKKVTTLDGIVGYETTWMVQPITIMGGHPASSDSESLPITYFELPGDKTSLVRVSLNKIEDLDIYEKMLKTVKFVTTPIELQLPPSSIPTLTVENPPLEIVIKEALVAKHGSDANSLEITVSQIDGNYAKGGASDQGGGGMWFAAKVNGVWKLVWDGNGVILCSDLTSYPNFPSSMIPECWNDKTQQTVVR